MTHRRGRFSWTRAAAWTASAAWRYCPAHALKIVKNPNAFRENANWRTGAIEEIYKQASTGGVLLSSMGSPERAAGLLGQAPHQRLPGDQPLH